MEATDPKLEGQIPTSSPSKAERDTTIEAINHLIQGKRHLLVQDIPSAVTSLQEACQLLAACYGEMANECGEAYFYYGKALLEMAREENSILGNAIGEDRDTDDDDDDDEEEDEGEDQQTDASKEASDEEAEQSKTSEEKGEDKPDGEKEVIEGAVDGQAGPSNAAPDSSKKEEAEDVSNLQLAWEMLELSKLIFSRQSDGNREKQLKLAEVHLYLGEVSLESENYSQAIEEFNQCLTIQTELLQPEDRLLAETHYQLGLAYSFNNLFDESVENFKRACQIIEDKIAVLSVIAAGKEMEKEPDIMSAGDPVTTAKKEIEELREILPEIREKIIDTEESKKNAIESVRNAALLSSSIIAEAINTPQSSSSASENFVASSSSESTNVKPTSNIGHLVKRKRKPEDDCDSELKRIRPMQIEQQPSSSDVSSSTESTQVMASAASTKVEGSTQMEATSSTSSSTLVNYITQTEEKEAESLVSEDVECAVTSATKCSERFNDDVKIGDGGHCDSVCNGENRDSHAISSHPIPELPLLPEMAMEATNI